MDDNFINCCQMMDPCEAVCLIDNAILQLTLGKRVISYQIGDEKFTMQAVSTADLGKTRAHFEALCRQSQGLSKRARFNGCLVYGGHYCQMCRRSNCRCG